MWMFVFHSDILALRMSITEGKQKLRKRAGVAHGEQENRHESKEQKRGKTGKVEK